MLFPIDYVFESHTKKRGTFSVFLYSGVWRDLSDRITTPPRLYSVSIFAITLVGFFSRQTFE